MKYEIGDKIIVLHSEEDGVVVEIINDKMVMIEVKGVKFPAYMDQIDFPYFKMFTKKNQQVQQKTYVDQLKTEKNFTKLKSGEGVHINLLPVYQKDVFDDDIIEKLKLYLVNQNEEEYEFNYTLSFSGENDFEHSGTIRALTDFYLHDIPFDKAGSSPSLDFQFSLVKPNKKKAPFYERSVKLRGKQLFKKLEELRMNNLPSFSYELFIEYPDKEEEHKVELTKLSNAGYKIYDASKPRRQTTEVQSVIDLHIEKLIDNWSRMTNFEIVTMQLNHFEKHFDLALLHRQPKLIVIHGLGQGKLRDAIHERLRQKNNVKSFTNEYHPLYGFGATEIYFQY